jgi:glucose/arabinose dehydrogenase
MHFHLRLLCLPVLLLMADRCWAEVPLNGLTDAEKRGGWKLIFDGKTTKGWRNYRMDAISDGWDIKDGAITWTRKGAGDIITVDQYKYFELSIEYKISKGGNSGIMFRVSEEKEYGAPFTGPEIQVQDNVDGHDPQKAGWLYQLYKPVKPAWAKKAEQQVGRTSPEETDATRPTGQWNRVYLRVAANKCEVAMNGISYYYFNIGDDDWNERVLKSKFAKFPKFGKNEQGHICLQDHGNLVAYRNIKIRTLPDDGAVPDPIDEKLALKGVPAFPNLKWEGWEGVDDQGKIKPLRPMVLTHANDGTGRNFVATQRGVIHVFENDPSAKQTKVFLDLTEKVHDWKGDNEEGLLGLAFHPKYKQNGEFFVYYSSEKKPRTSIVSRFRVSKDDPNKADPTEEVVMRIPQPYANHNGGSIAFGPDGYLTIGLGDGGGRNDPLGHGQNLETWMGSVLRIDVDKKDGDRNYAIPPDNPFVNHKKAKPEIFAYGFRNIWRLSFDRKTGALWAADVGQDLWEEIDIVKAGGNYGWSARESSYGFGNLDSVGSKPIDPVWEYDHQVGKSITGGYVYRGARLPQLNGAYLHADFVTGKIWALKYDEQSGKVEKNLSIASTGIPVLAFGEDAAGEVYYFLETVSGQGIYRFERTE